MKIETFEAKTQKDIDLVLKKLSENEVIACDIETDWFDWRRTKLLSIGFSWKPYTGVSVPFYHKEAKICVNINELRDILKDKKLIFHNAQFDLKQLWTHGIGVEAYFDTMLAHYVTLDERQGTHGLKVIAKNLLNIEYQDVHEVVNVKKRTFEHIPLDILLKYNAYDAAATFLIYEYLKDKVPDIFYYLIMPASKTLAKMEFRGIKVDRDYLIKIKNNETKKLQILESEFKTKYYFNPKSPKEALGYFKSKGYKLKRVDKWELIRLAKTNKVAKELQQYRKVQKLVGSYTDSLLEKLDENCFLHTHYLLHGTVSGRIASRNPSLQTISRDEKVRKMFISSKGCIFLEADYKQAEMRIAAILSGDENLLNTFKEKRDIHQETAKRIFNKDDINKDERMLAKSINFGFIYGRGPESVALDADVSFKEAREWFKRFYRSYPKILDFMNKCENEAKHKRKITTLTGRVRRYRETAPERSFKTSVNFPIASLQSDICLKSLCVIDRIFDKVGLKTRPVLTVHDSLLFEVPECELSSVARIIKNVMEKMPNKFIKNNPLEFPVDISVGKNWNDLKKYEYQKDLTDEKQLKMFDINKMMELEL